MKIPKIATIRTSFQQCLKKAELKLYPNRRFSLSENFDTFCREDYLKNINNSKLQLGMSEKAKRKLGIKLINNISEMTPETYKKLKPSEKENIRMAIPKEITQISVKIEYISRIIKNVFDNKYGKDNYVFVSVGRSLSATAKCLEFIGVKTINIPFSGVNAFPFSKPNIPSILNQPGINKYIKFLEEQGLANQDKKHIFCDYCITGKTLNTFKQIIESPEVGLKSSNNVFVHINKCLQQIGKKRPEYNKVIQNFIFDLTFQTYDNVASIRSLNYKKLFNIDNARKPTDSNSAKFMQFCLLDIINSKNL